MRWRAGCRSAGFLAFCLLIAGCTHPTAPVVVCVTPPATPPRTAHLRLDAAVWSDLPGWRSDDLVAAARTLGRSCPHLVTMTVDASGLTQGADWRAPCADLARIGNDRAAAKAFFEHDFRPFAASDNGNAQGLFTGYYEAELKGSLTPAPGYAVPLYRRPTDLVSVDLGVFRPEWHGRRVAGRVEAGRLEPYAARNDIEAGVLTGKGLEIAWVSDPVDAFFLEIQGSGRVLLPGGQALRIGYDGDNGREYESIGRMLAEQGVPVAQVNMPFLRQWLHAHPAEGRALMDRNPAYVFFKPLVDDGPFGAEGVALEPGRSAAIDPAYLPYGMPIFVDTSDADAASGRLSRLFIAQDTGGAIRGVVRADLFFGYGAGPEREAGDLRGQGRMWLLLPEAAAERVQ